MFLSGNNAGLFHQHREGLFTLQVDIDVQFCCDTRNDRSDQSLSLGSQAHLMDPLTVGKTRQ